MKFKFKIQKYQSEVVEDTVSVFNGQRKYEHTTYMRDMGTEYRDSQRNMLPGVNWSTDEADGFCNHEIELTDQELLENIQRVQDANNIKRSSSLAKHIGRCSLDIEMETGTGKTYVYIKTMFELNKLYGWSKFIVVVPSIAIREGVKKTFEVTQDHFMELYGKKARFFIYNSSDLGKLDDFSSNSGINVMIINTQAFASSLNEEKNKEGRTGDKAARIIYTQRDNFGSRRPIDVIAANRPIIIMDEPQKMGGEVTQKSLQSFKPLFCLNYSATHKVIHNLIYVLDALDAYNKRLVKKIQVKGIEEKNFQGKDGYLYLESILVSASHAPMARMELEVAHQGGIKRESRKIQFGDNLFITSGNLEQYRDGYVVTEINPLNGGKVVFQNGVEVRPGQAIGDISEKDMRRIQIRETILSHFEKEEELFKRGIKTLSLFFIDEVAKYRQYDDAGNELLGEYGKIFEEEYVAVLNSKLSLFDSEYQRYLKGIDAHDTHRGYFSIDKKTGRAIDSTGGGRGRGKRGQGEDISDDVSAYDLILKKKEVLLSFEEPTRFIFSHSALREGWDNPNVFQICTLKHSDNTIQKRQEVGRGMRLCVDKDGVRMDSSVLGEERVQELNKLTVIASESYKSFVEDLQKTIKADLRDRAVKATVEYFAGKSVKIEDTVYKISDDDAQRIWNYLDSNDYIDGKKVVTDRYRSDAQNGTLAPLPAKLDHLPAEVIHTVVQAIFDDRMLDKLVEDGHEVKIEENELNDNFYRKEFQELWGYINHKYAYTVQFDSAELIAKAVDHLDKKLTVSAARYTVETGEQTRDMNREELNQGESFHAASAREQELRNPEASQVKYDLLGKIAEGTVLTRRTVAEILQKISAKTFAMFRQNPEEFIAKTIRLIKEQKATMIVDAVSYNQIDGSYESSIFTAGMKQKNFKNAFKATKSIQDYVFTDGTAQESVERRFVEDLDKAQEVCVYAKLPKGFSIPTPVGNYSPDWAIAFNAGAVKHIFFIAETKGSMDSLELRPIEQAKISCAKKLFNELSTSHVKYHEVDSYQNLLNIMSCL